jgi:hypothetical protein
VAPTTTGAPNGSIDHPFTSFTSAINAVAAGDTIYVRGGTYNLSSRIDINKSGTSANPISMLAYPGETPVLDFTAQATSSSSRGVQLGNSANWWHIKGLTIQHAGDNGLYTEGDNGLFEQIVTRWNEDSGFQLHGTATNNLVLNCDSYENYDVANHGENADGFAAKFDQLGPGNIIRGSRSWGNSDDGWDMWMGTNGVLVQSSWSFGNGVNIWGDASFQGDGNGFKLGHDGGPHILANILAWGNRANGIDVNGNGYHYDENDKPTTPNGSHVEVYNSTSYNNGGANWRFDEDITHILRNNVSLKTIGGSGNVVNGPVDDTFNTWNGIPVDANDFLSLVDTIARGPRNMDGSLPESAFLRLVSNSNLIDAGTPISFGFNGTNYTLAYNGAKPDLGAIEAGAPALPGDYNSDGAVDAADFVLWRASFNKSVTLPNDVTPGIVDDSDYAVWRSHFGATLGGGAVAGALSAVPEPSTLFSVAITGLLLAGLQPARRNAT